MSPLSLLHLVLGEETRRGPGVFSIGHPTAQDVRRAVLWASVPCLQSLAQCRALLRGAGKDFGSCGDVDAVAVDTQGDGAGAGGEAGCLLALPASLISRRLPCLRPQCPASTQPAMCALRRGWGLSSPSSHPLCAPTSPQV